jgi:hypothetical protein
MVIKTELVDPTNKIKKNIFSKGTYDPRTKTYTDPEGNKYSYASAPAGATIVLTKGTSGGSASSGGRSYVDTSTGRGYEVSATGERTIVPTGTEQEKIKEYTASQTALYQNAIVQSARDTYNKSIGYGKWESATAYEKNKYIKEAYNKLSPQFKERVGSYSQNLVMQGYNEATNKPAGKTPAGSYSVYTPPTQAQLTESQRLRELYGETGVSRVTKVAWTPVENLIYKGDAVAEQIRYSSRATPTREDQLNIQAVPSLYGATSTYIQKPEAVEKERFKLGFLPEWNFKPEQFAKNLYYNKEGEKRAFISSQEIRILTKGTSFLAGGYSGVKNYPVKTAVTLGTFIAVPSVLSKLKSAGLIKAGFKGGGSVARSTLKGVWYGSIATRIAITEGGTYAKYYKAGEITTTEVIPVFTGLKVGSMFTKSRVIYVAKQQKLTNKILRTDVRFITDSGRVGKLSAYSKIVNQGGKLQVLYSRSRGIYTGRFIEGDYSKNINSPFATKSLSFGKGRGNIINQVSLGKSANIGFSLRNPLVSVKKFGSIGAGLQRKNFIYSIGVSKVRGVIPFYRTSYQAGIIKIVPENTGGYIQILGGGTKGLSLPFTEQQKISNFIQGSIASTLKPEVLPAVSSVSLSTTGIVSNKIFVVKGENVKTSSISVPVFESKYLTSEATLLRTSVTARSKSISRSSSQLKSIQQEITIPKEAQSQTIAQQQRSQSKYLQQNITLFNEFNILPVIPTTKTVKPFIPFKLPKIKETSTNNLGIFSVFVRRFGVFKPVGTAKTFSKAFSIGKERVSKTLGATFKVTGSPQYFKTPKGFYTKYSKKEGLLFIEQTKYRLSTTPEKKEIQYFKKLKGGII